jgi:hypothetical protein
MSSKFFEIILLFEKQIITFKILKNEAQTNVGQFSLVKIGLKINFMVFTHVRTGIKNLRKKKKKKERIRWVLV